MAKEIKTIDKDITNEVSFERNDDEHLPLTKCACGAKFEPWDFILGIERDYPKSRLHCKRKLYFTVDIKVYEILPIISK